MLDNNGFDQWAEEYDGAVAASDEDNTYPFAGYRNVLEKIRGIVSETEHAAVLDLGFGTGTLTAELYNDGCIIYGQDFSSKMIELASEKMPLARLYQGDFSKGPAGPLTERKYDYIISTYAMHHLDDVQKITLIHTLRGLLNENGKIVIGDVAFGNRTQLEQCRQQTGSDWDEDEYYFIADELKTAFPELRFLPVSHCAGILTLTR